MVASADETVETPIDIPTETVTTVDAPIEVPVETETLAPVTEVEETVPVAPIDTTEPVEKPIEELPPVATEEVPKPVELIVTEEVKPIEEAPVTEPREPDKEVELPKQTEAPKPVTQNEVNIPIATVGGYQVVGTQDSQVLIQEANGTVVAVSAEIVGGTVQKDGTVALKTKENDLVVLPKTGDSETMAVSALGFMSVFAGLFLRLRKR
ncbi:LPXTG cell wall anchor domain-containing protein [Streptococcus sp. S784/96/1]|uniref:LPXTG cell wall anchor domain-containing protein n=1 Tax=Streptococcus sp. S784/96/1 TaxID=2653499 RepID=UPI0013875BCA|nr:LPXTG cell wall anchor domain-containing protein [Streptococcus sp. S784/96/1]